jgi:transcriptional regulator with XRE-family HTH domain
MKTKRRRPAVAGIRAIRERLGLTQKELADLLQVGRSTVLMNERGERSLPGPAVLRAARLEIKLAAAPAIGREKLNWHPSEKLQDSDRRHALGLMTDRENKCRLQSHQLSAKLDSISALYFKTREWLQLIDAALEEGDFTLAGENLWWKYQQTIALEKLSRCGAPEQALLRNKIALLEGEAELNRKIYLQFASGIG